MKRFFLLLTVSLSVVAVSAQKYDEVKTLFMLNQFEKAKTELDKAFTNAKFISKPEAFILKAAIYAGLGTSETKKNTPEAEQLMTDADEAFAKFKSMDPKMELLSDLSYQNGPINLYSNYYTTGYKDYSSNKWATGLAKLKKAVEYSDILIGRKLLTTTLDTNVLILAGITAEKSGNADDAANYYTRLAEGKVAGDGFEGVYRFLVSHSFAKKDMTAFEKYKAMGKDLYPKSDYFNYDKIDFAVGLMDNFNDKLAALEQVMATDPDNQKANQVLGEIIYDTLNPKGDNPPAAPANAAELEKKMITAFNKSANGKPGYEIPYLYIGDHFINKATRVNERREAHTKDMKARTKPGTMSSKEDVAKRDALDKEYGETLEGAREPYEKAAAILAAKDHLETRDKQQYKKAASYLADIFAFKKIMAKGKPADQAKYAAEEKKWNDVYESIKN
ncbi:MAG: hypothetical protein HYZ15_15985 [Sphingobacteriales bacterium]|nr:hypothetical protein [Sphingobacteriales bacterium]